MELRNCGAVTRLSPSLLNAKEMALELAERLRRARQWYQRYWKVLCHPDLHYRTKFQLYRFFVRPILTYGCELWTLNNQTAKRLRRFEYSVLLEIYKSMYPHRHPKRLRPNLISVFGRYQDVDVVEYVKNERLTWSVLLENEQRALRNNSLKRTKRVHWWDRNPEQSVSKHKPIRDKSCGASSNVESTRSTANVNASISSSSTDDDPD